MLPKIAARRQAPLQGEDASERAMFLSDRPTLSLQAEAEHDVESLNPVRFGPEKHPHLCASFMLMPPVDPTSTSSMQCLFGFSLCYSSWLVSYEALQLPQLALLS